MKRLLIVLCISFLSITSAKAQELNCQIEVLTDRVQGVNPAIFQNLREILFELMNNRKWTNDNFTIEERINCSMIINIDPGASASSNTYKATLQAISGRPVYGTDYSSPLVNLRDEDFVFEFVQGAQYNFNPDQFQGNLMSVMAFYAYIIIGYDYDSFSPRGGTPYFEMANRIVQSAQGASAPGWKAFEGDKNRYWIVSDLLHRTFEPLRDCLYQYHRQGFDQMSEKMTQGRSAVLASLDGFDKIHRIKPMAYITQNFFLAKSDEIVNLFSQALPPERNAVFELLSRVDPGNISKYEKMQKGK